jgi:hypothetical protein
MKLRSRSLLLFGSALTIAATAFAQPASPPAGQSPVLPSETPAQLKTVIDSTFATPISFIR